MKKSLFPIGVLVIWCSTWSKNLGRFLSLVPQEKNNPQHHNKFMSGNFCTLNFKISTLCWYHMKRLTVQFRWHCNAMHYQNLQCMSDYCGNISRQVQCILDLVTLLEFVRKWLFSEDREEKGNDVTSTTFQLLIILIWRACRWNSETISSLDLRW